MLFVPQVFFVPLSFKGRCGLIVGINLCNSFWFRGSLVHLQLCNTEEDQDHWTEAHLVKGRIVISRLHRLVSVHQGRRGWEVGHLSNSSKMYSPEDAEGLPHPEPHPECKEKKKTRRKWRLSASLGLARLKAAICRLRSGTAGSCCEEPKALLTEPWEISAIYHPSWRSYKRFLEAHPV